jgi:putative glycosyltransferase (exosortase G-associated)
MSRELIRVLIFWGIWLVIPLLVDVFIGIFSGLVVMIAHLRRKKTNLEFLPYITILVPIYKSYKTLEGCIQSIADQSYPIKNMMIILINNGPEDGSHEIFAAMQERYSNLRMRWIDSSQGKSKALNKGLYMAEGKYIINIDSDGILEKNAILRVVEKFESDQQIYAGTGVVLIDDQLIEKTEGIALKLMQRCELFEYIESFVVGRGFQSWGNTMFTVAGAFSCYRKDIVLRTQLYNNETLGEDIHMTSQIRNLNKGKITLCEDAFFFVDPIDSWDKLYIQRQRWQRGALEVSSLFNNTSNRQNKLRNILQITMLKDHTLVFPRFIWIFAMMYLVFLDYPMSLIVGANLIMYLVYVLNSLLYYFVARLYLKNVDRVSKYVNRHFYIVLLLPIYRFVVFFMRLAGIINAAQKYAAWNARTLTEEKEIVGDRLKGRLKIYFKLKDWINNG